MAKQAVDLEQAFQMVFDRLHVVEAKEQSLRAVTMLLLNLHPDKEMILAEASAAVRSAAKEIGANLSDDATFLDLVLAQINALAADAQNKGQVVRFPGGPSRP